MGDEELPRDVAGPHSHHGELDDPAADIVGQRPPVHEDAAQLVHARLTWNRHNIEKLDRAIILHQYFTRNVCLLSIGNWSHGSIDVCDALLLLLSSAKNTESLNHINKTYTNLTQVLLR